ncbi:MAG: DUF1934 domain-containing protein [Clostridiales bacterium]|nr:DUF1934 domain-containing protein [Clostridiales bacterium]
MASKNVIIRIVDSHESDGENSTSELITVGTLDGFGDNYSLVYTEQDDALQGCITTIKVEDKKRIIMTRTGEISAEMIIEKDKRHNCHYITPHGDFMMGVFARYIKSKMNADGGELKFEYTIDFNTGLASVNELKVTVKEANDNVPLS